MGKLTNLNPSKILTEGDMPSGMATDNEVIAALNVHVNGADPHPIYLTQAEGDARYRQITASFYTGGALLPANVAGNSIGFGWNSVQPGGGIAEICNYSGTGGGDTLNFFRLPGNPVQVPSLSNRVARIDINGSYVQVSDRRLKSHFEVAPGLEALMALKPLRYAHWSCAGFDREANELKLGKFFTNKLGFIAQEVYEVIPEAVQKPTTNEDLWGVDYNCVLVCSVKALQELSLKIEKLEQEIVQLKAKLKV